MEAVPESLLREALGHANAAVTVFTADRRYLAVNERYLALTGYSREEVMAHRAGMGVRLEPLGDEHFRELISAGVSSGEADILRKDGTPLALEFVVIPTEVDGEQAYVGISWPLVPGHEQLAATHEEREER